MIKVPADARREAILRMLEGGGGMTTAEVAARLGVHRRHADALLKELEKFKRVERRGSLLHPVWRLR